MSQVLKNRYLAIQLAVDANKAGIPAYPLNLDKNKWVVVYDPKDMMMKKQEE